MVLNFLFFTKSKNREAWWYKSSFSGGGQAWPGNSCQENKDLTGFTAVTAKYKQLVQQPLTSGVWKDVMDVNDRILFFLTNYCDQSKHLITYFAFKLVQTEERHSLCRLLRFSCCKSSCSHFMWALVKGHSSALTAAFQMKQEIEVAWTGRQRKALQPPCPPARWELCCGLGWEISCCGEMGTAAKLFSLLPN